MNVYKPLLIFNVAESITILTDGCTTFRKFLVEGTKPNLNQITMEVPSSRHCCPTVAQCLTTIDSWG
jgi:fumarate hydratase, class II